MPKEIDFDGLVAEAYRQSANRRKNAQKLVAELQGKLSEQVDEEVLRGLDTANAEATLSLSIGTMVEFLSARAASLHEFDDTQRRQMEEFIREQKRKRSERVEEIQAAIKLQAYRKGMDVSKFIDPEIQTGPSDVEEAEQEEKKRIGIERIRRNMGNLEAFKTGNAEVDERLGEALGDYWGMGQTRIVGFMRKFGDHDVPTIADFLSHTEEELSTIGNH